MKVWKKIPRTTVGRFWGYVGIAMALGTSLAGNIYSARLHTPGTDPTNTEIAFAGLPPLVAFIAIELVNHNPWKSISWGKYITRVLLFVVAPGSALVSFVHLTLVGLNGQGVEVPDNLQKWLNIATAILTALLIDGLILGGTAALLLPKPDVIVDKAEDVLTEPVAAITAYPDFRAEINAATAPLVAMVEQQSALIAELTSVPATRPARPRVKAALAKQTAPAKERTRFPAGEHPVWEGWLAASTSGQPWSVERVQKEVKTKMGKDLSVEAAAGLIRRFTGHAKTLQNA